MPRQLLDEARVSRQTFEATSFAEAEEADRESWHSRAFDECLEALELSRW